MSADKPVYTIECFESLRFLSETHRALHEQRRKYEMQVFFTTLIFYAAVSLAALDGESVILRSMANKYACVVWFLSLALAAFTALFLQKLHFSNDFNMKLAENSENDIIGFLDDNGHDVMPKQPKQRLSSTSIWYMSSLYWETIVLFVFAFVAAAILTIS